MSEVPLYIGAIWDALEDLQAFPDLHSSSFTPSSNSRYYMLCSLATPVPLFSRDILRLFLLRLPWILAPPPRCPLPRPLRIPAPQRESFIDNLLVRIHLIIEMT